MHKLKDLAGYVFNNITVIYRCDYQREKQEVWHCRCNCDEGSEFDLTVEEIKKGIIQNCGCKPVELKGIKNNLLGKKFSNLTVRGYVGKSKWLCKCDCGNFKIFTGQHLREKAAKSCGKCINHYEDLKGQKFGKLTANYYVKSNSDRRAIWNCTCECGREVERLARTLKKKDIFHMCDFCEREAISRRSRLDLVGQVFGELTVLSFAFVYQERTYWKCQCSCGKKCIVRGKELKRGAVKSCKHLKHRTGEDNPNFVDIAGNVYNFLIALEQVDGRNWRFLCTNCGNDNFVARRNDVIAGKVVRCDHCSIQKSGSIPEKEIKEYIASLTECSPVKERILPIGSKGQEIDIYYKEFNIGIEYNGSVFHATKGAAYGNNKLRGYHRDKFLCAKSLGIHLITIFDVDWQNNKEKIKMYLRSLFTTQAKLMARKCSVKHVDKYVADYFTDRYHIQGKTPYHNINYGLYYKDDLVAVMTFDVLRMAKNKDGYYELHRYCVKDGYTIVGGANKLLKAFEREYHPKYIKSYSDNDCFKGDIYERLGFDNDGQCSPRYYWFLNNEEIKREKCKLSKLELKYPDLLQEAKDENAPNKEDYVMLSLGACKVYRSGHTRWVKYYGGIS